MAKKKECIPEYSTTTKNGVMYYRTRITDADGKRVDLYATTREELYKKEQEARQIVVDLIFRKKNPTVADYCEKWLLMHSAKVSKKTLEGYTRSMTKYIVKPLGHMYLSDVTADDIRMALIPASKKSAGLYAKVNMLVKSVFYSAICNDLIDNNPSANISAKGGTQLKGKEALTDEQAEILFDAVRGLPPYLFVMIGFYSGLRREEILGLQWDCVFLDAPTPYISVRRAWRTEQNKSVVSTTLKSPAAKRDVPIPKCLVDCLREAKAKSISAYVIANRKGEPLSASQFDTVWRHVVVRSTKLFKQPPKPGGCFSFPSGIELSNHRW